MLDIPIQTRLLTQAEVEKTCEEFWKNRLTRLDYLEDKVKVMSDQIIALHRMILDMKKGDKE